MKMKMLMYKNNRRSYEAGVSTIIVVLLILVAGVLVGGVFYFLGSQTGTGGPTNDEADNIEYSAQVSNSSTDAEIETEINETDESLLNQDFTDIDRDASSF